MFGIKIISKAEYRELKKAVSESVDAAVATLKRVELPEGTLGDAILDSINIVGQKDISNKEKFEQVVGEFGPVVLRYVRSGGVPAALADVESLVRHLVQSVFNENKSTTFARIAQALLRVL